MATMPAWIREWGEGRLARLPEHRNAGLELVHVFRGRLEWQVEGREHVLGAGDLFFTLPWERHGSLLEYEPGHEWAYIVVGTRGEGPETFDWDPRLKMSDVIGSRIAERLLGTSTRKVSGGAESGAAMRGLMADLRSGDAWAEDSARLRVQQLLLLLARKLSDHPGESRPEPNELVSHLARQVGERLDRAWSLMDLARASGLGRTRLTEVIGAATGDSPMAFVRRIRLSAARQQLIENDRPVAEIALDCGFASGQHFARWYRRQYGESPTQTRTQQRK